MELNQFMPLRDLFTKVRTRKDRRVDYSVYWKDGAEDPRINEGVLLAAPVMVEDDRDVFPPIVNENGYWLVALQQNPKASDETLLSALLYYLSKDNFLDVTNAP